MTYLSLHRVRRLLHERGLHVGEETLEILATHVETIVEDAAGRTEGAGGKRISPTTMRVAINGHK